MKIYNPFSLLSGILIIFFYTHVSAQNPIIRNQFTANPSARVFNGQVYLYPSHDILATKDRGRIGWFCMQDYHVFSSTNLTGWTDHGVIVSQDKVKWVDSTSYSMWAPDCIKRNGKYYFCFPSQPKGDTSKHRFAIGIAISDSPSGPFTPQPKPIKNIHGVDPNPFIDKDGQAYLYWAEGNIYVARLKDNMLELASKPQIVKGLPEKGLKEGPFLFKRNGKYYLTYPHVANKTERLEYAISDNPMGPFKVTGVLMDESSSGCWTNHPSIIKFRDQWYLFYHNDDLSPHYDKARSVRIDSLFFNADGTIRKVIPTLRGVGRTDASRKIQIDRYSKKSSQGASIAFLDTLDTFKGWKTTLDNRNAWIQYNAVDFGSKRHRSVQVKAFSKTGGTLQIRIDKTDGPLLAEVKIPKGTEWNMVHSQLLKFPKGIHNLVVISEDNDPVEIDWISFI